MEFTCLLVFFSSLVSLFQLLTFDATSSANAPLPTCLHLFYKLAERRGPQVTVQTTLMQTALTHFMQSFWIQAFCLYICM